MSETRCPECQCLLKDKDFVNDKCWKCGLTPIMEIIGGEEQKFYFEKIEQKKQERLDEKEKWRQEEEQKRQEKEQILKNRTLSEKFEGLRTYQIYIWIIGLLSISGFVKFLLEFSLPSIDIIIYSIILIILMWYNIINIIRIIDFLFELDKRISDKK